MSFEYIDRIRKEAPEIIKSKGNDEAYDLATDILHLLSRKGYCIWQTYTKEDIKVNTGEYPTDEEMEELGYNLQDFENIRV